MYEKIYYAAAWQEYLFENVYTVSDEDIENYYQENKADYDAADYYSYSVPYTSYTYTEPAEGESVEEGLPASEEEAETMTTESKAAAQEHANNLLAMISDAGTFDEVASEYYYNGIVIDGDAEAEYEDYTTALVELGALTGTDAVTEWLKDESRTAGDKTVIEEDTAYTVLLFVSRYRDESKVVSARHILIQTAALMELHEITDSMTDAEKEIAELANEEILAANEESVSGNSDAKAWIDSILEQWENSDKSEGFFAELAEQYSEDSGSNTQGGLYENFGEGEMVGPFNDWCFDPARQKGDYDVIETEFGYHLMYMVEPGQVAYILIIRNILQNEMYSGYLTEAQESRDMATNNFGLKICF